MSTSKLVVLAIASAAFAAGCVGGNDHEDTQPQTPAQPKVESFTDWSKNGVYAKPAEGAPVNMDTLVWTFDGDENPNAYADLLPPET